MILELNGIMTDGVDPDDEPLARAGIITDCFMLAKAIRECNEDIILKINSYGGSVEGSTAISTALVDWKRNHPDHKAIIEVGAICASAAANLVAVLAGRIPVLVHPESMLMFHSCSGLVEGTPEQLKDEADRMEKINEVVINALNDNTLLLKEQIEQWFMAGREGWLSGMEAVNCHLADGFINTDIETMPVIPTGEKRFVAIAAIAQKLMEKKTMDEEKKTIIETEVEKPLEEMKKEVEIEKTEEKPVEEVETEVEKTEETEVEEPKAEDDELTALKAENEQLKAEIEELKATCEKLTQGLKSTGAKATAKKTFAELVREIPANLPEREYTNRFTALKKQYNAEYKAYMDSHKRR